MEYEYFVVYHYKDEYKSGTGNTWFTLNFEIINYDQIKELQNTIKKNNILYSTGNVIITNYKLLSKNKTVQQP